MIDIEQEEQKIQTKQLRERAEKEQKRQEETEKAKQQALEQQDQHSLINSLIEYFNLMDETVPLRLIKHYLKKQGVKKDYLSFAVGEIEEKVYLLQKEQQIQIDEQISQYQVNLESERFEFEEEEFLTSLSKTPKEKGKIRSWGLMVEVYRDKQEDLKIDEIAQKHGIAGGSVSNYVNKVAGKIAEEMGLQYEKFRAAKLKETYPNAEIQIAKDHSKQPDIVLKFPDRI
ncbi:MAG: hypothetical protein ACFE9L_12015 [Candidatus Hodarchaeota archaeon]